VATVVVADDAAVVVVASAAAGAVVVVVAEVVAIVVANACKRPRVVGCGLRSARMLKRVLLSLQSSASSVSSNQHSSAVDQVSWTSWEPL
jgi:hypothetical protein